MLTPEELLSPRWEVIALYPHAPFEKDYIIEQADNLMGAQWYKNVAPQYPHLFRPMGWAERRKPSQLPKYVVSRSATNIMLKVKGWETMHGKVVIRFTSGNSGYAEYYLPVDENFTPK